MRILVTGATGYLGSRICRSLLSKGHTLYAIKRRSSDLLTITDIKDEIFLVNADDFFGRDFKSILSNIDLIIHTATAYGRKNETKEEIYFSNLVLPLKIIECLINYPNIRFINTDTSLSPDVNFYSASKRLFLNIAKKMFTNSQASFINIRLEYFYGPNNINNDFITSICYKCLNNISPISLTKGEQKRDFVYITDVISGYNIIISEIDKIRSSYCEFQLGSGRVISIKDLVQTIHSISSSSSVLNFGFIEYRLNEQMYSKADIRALSHLGWSPKVEIHEGVSIVLKNTLKN